jgi:DnaJ-class molecular chaperone
VLTCPQCNGTASRRNPCRFCGTRGYKLHDPNDIQMHLRPAITDDKREGIKAVAR